MTGPNIKVLLQPRIRVKKFRLKKMSSFGIWLHLQEEFTVETISNNEYHAIMVHISRVNLEKHSANVDTVR